MNHERESRAIKFGIAFWLAVLSAVLWWVFIHPSDTRLLIPSFWWVDACVLSPASTFVFESCAADATVADTDSIAAGFLTMFVIMMLWIIQYGLIAAVPIVGYAYAERFFSND